MELKCGAPVATQERDSGTRQTATGTRDAERMRKRTGPSGQAQPNQSSLNDGDERDDEGDAPAREHRCKRGGE